MKSLSFIGNPIENHELANYQGLISIGFSRLQSTQNYKKISEKRELALNLTVKR
jgi:hypothetical protein